MPKVYSYHQYRPGVDVAMERDDETPTQSFGMRMRTKFGRIFFRRERPIRWMGATKLNRPKRGGVREVVLTWQGERSGGDDE